VGLNQTIDYKFPQYTTNDTSEVVTLKLALDSSQQKFLTYIPSLGVLRAKPTLKSQVGDYYVAVSLVDSRSSIDYSLLVQVKLEQVVEKNSTNKTNSTTGPINKNLTAKITGITLDGVVTVSFNRPILVWPDASTLLSSPSVLSLSVDAQGS
jgi:hypothetical protein